MMGTQGSVASAAAGTPSSATSRAHCMEGNVADMIELAAAGHSSRLGNVPKAQ